MKEIKRTTVRELLANPSEYVGKEVDVKGWVRTRRGNKNVQFIALNDGSTIKNLQIVVALDRFTDDELLKLVTTGAAIHAQGPLVESQGKGQTVELQADDLQVYGTADSTYPLQKKGHTMEFLREKAHLRPRTNTFGAVLRIRHALAFAVHDFFNSKGFNYFHTPLITASDCEGAGAQFQVTTLPLDELPRTEDGQVDYSKDFFGKMASLTVSGQLEGELGATALGCIYTFGPTFRAENSNTPRHAAEFWMIEPEMAFAELEDIMELGEGLTRHVVDHALTRCESDLKLFDNFVDKGLIDRLKGMLAQPFARVSYRDAIHILEDSGKEFTFPVAFGVDLQTEHERFLAEEHFRRPVIVYDYPKEIKAFYMRGNDDGETVAAMDVLVPRIGELIGGSQREERLDKLLARIAEMGQKPEDYWWYLDLRRFGSVPHAGFGMGFERLLMMLTGITNIRDVIPFPRTPGSLEF